MRVALDEQIFAIQRYGGISRMFAELARQFVVHAVADVELQPLDAPIVNRYILDHPELAGPLGVRQARNEWTALARYMSRVTRVKGVDIVHNTFYLPHGLAPKGAAKRVVTVHDMIPEMMHHTRRLDWLTLKQKYVKGADHVICVSEATKQDLLRLFGPLDVPVTVVHHGVADRFHPGAPRLDFLPEKYVLFVGNRDQYKDGDVLFRAFSVVAKEHRDIHLVCIGGTGLTAREIARLEDLGIRERVQQRFLPDEAMVSAYAHARVFVFPSRFEGFGLPALEAMATGTPCLLARATSLPEVGGEAAAYFEPGSAEDLAISLSALLGDDAERDRLRTLGLKRAAGFTWLAAARKTADVYRSVVG